MSRRRRRLGCERGRPLRWSRSRRRRQRSDDGIATIQNAVLYPIVMVLLLAIVQGGLYFYAQNVARSAANSAVQVTRATGGTVDGGRQEADAQLTLAGSALRDAHVSIDRGPAVATVTITGKAMSLVPGLDLTIRQTATGPVERFTQGSS